MGGITASRGAGICQAWVNFNGTGTVAIRASGNVSSITDNGLGDYTVNFTTALVDANYSMVQGCGNTQGIGLVGFYETLGAPTTTSCRIAVVATGTPGIPLADFSRITLSFMR